MDSHERDTTSSYLQLINCVKNFRGADSYIIDVIRRMSRLSTEHIESIAVDTPSDVASLLSKISTNRL